MMPVQDSEGEPIATEGYPNSPTNTHGVLVTRTPVKLDCAVHEPTPFRDGEPIPLTPDLADPGYMRFMEFLKKQGNRAGTVLSEALDRTFRKHSITSSTVQESCKNAYKHAEGDGTLSTFSLGVVERRNMHSARCMVDRYLNNDIADKLFPNGAPEVTDADLASVRLYAREFASACAARGSK